MFVPALSYVNIDVIQTMKEHIRDYVVNLNAVVGTVSADLLIAELL